MILHKSFSIIEIIFVILIISIISTIAIPKLLNISHNTTIIKAKNDLFIIQNALKNYTDNIILQNKSNTLNTLDDSIFLFDKILDKPFIPSIHKISFWSKKTNTIYEYWVDTNKSIQFIYDKSNLTFQCEKTNTLCQEVLK